MGILQLITQFQSEEKKRVEQEALRQRIQWRFKDELGQYQAYEADVNAAIEEAYQRKQRYVELDLEEVKLKVDFKSMVETSLSNPRHRLKVYRADLMKGNVLQRISAFFPF